MFTPRTKARIFKIVLVLILSFSLFWIDSPVATAKPQTEEGDPFNQINSVLIEGAKPVKYKTYELSKDAFSTAKFELKKSEEAIPKKPRKKIHPLLQSQIQQRPLTESETLIINFQDDVSIPRFPEPDVDKPRDSVENKKAIFEANRIIRDLKSRRADNYKKLTKELEIEYQAKVQETFWLVNAVVVKMPLGSVSKMANRKDVMFIEPEKTIDEPPQNANPNDDVDDGRSRIVSDPYFNLGLTNGWIGLLDTGLRFTHTQFNNPSNVALRFDCVNGGTDCNSGTSVNPNDDCWNHGTRTAGVITANANQGNPYRGVTGITLDSFKVYPTSFNSRGSCNGFLNTTATVRGFQRALSVLDRVIVAEMQGSGNDVSTISMAADNAFDAGAVVIAANGNNGPNASTVNVPANAHKVIGVGNFDVQTQDQIISQSRGPAPDNRFKPDIQAPTNTETASNTSDTALQRYTGTSGATPYGAGAAALLRNWLREISTSIDPGQVYSHLILSGQQPYPFDNTTGAGPLGLPTDGWSWWGKVNITDGSTVEIPLSITGDSPNNFDGALWWPESASQDHNDIDLALIDPSDTIRDSSISIPSVFERTNIRGTVAPGTWKLRIQGYSVPTQSQTVYWSAHVRL
ncbi:S8 family serine peptidase [Acaryochloris sp. IP29b_bin.148]|uniref:S8 family peptidase n=1 Tax=Acaryochloris sp. IP29b_bin.148 TaxID=2969218 RepID=UPI002604D6B4|nr:S8 family serine peptidase [Acaryochloris sp. IP29b_bin.148]